MKKRGKRIKKKRAKKNSVFALLFIMIALVGLLRATDVFLMSSSQEKNAITGAVVAETVAVAAEAESAETKSSEPAASTDVSAWQGQYYKGVQFQTGTFEFNFTVYDAPVGGGHAILTQLL